MATESISRLLVDSSELRPLAARLSQIQRLQRRFRSLAPGQLAESCRVCAIDGTTVVVMAASGPVAAVLRQLAPRLLQGLREAAHRSPKHPEDQELTGMRIELQVTASQPKRPAAARTPPPKDKLAGIAKGLADSPLKETLERMARPKRG